MLTNSRRESSIPAIQWNRISLRELVQKFYKIQKTHKGEQSSKQLIPTESTTWQLRKRRLARRKAIEGLPNRTDASASRDVGSEMKLGASGLERERISEERSPGSDRDTRARTAHASLPFSRSRHHLSQQSVAEAASSLRRPRNVVEPNRLTQPRTMSRAEKPRKPDTPNFSRRCFG